MVEKKDDLNLESMELLSENYVPSETERKRVVVYYFLVGVLFALSQKSLTKYEYFHLKQAIGWWIVFFLVFVSSLFLWFIPFLGWIPFLLQLALFWIWLFFIKQAWEWKYVVVINWKEKIPLPIFEWLGWWLLELFEKKFEIK